MLQRTVYPQVGAPLGTLEDIIVDAHAGRVPFVCLRRHEKLHPLPLDALREKEGTLVLVLDSAVLDAGPGFSAAELDANLTNSDFLRRYAAYADGLTAKR